MNKPFQISAGSMAMEGGVIEKEQTPERINFKLILVQNAQHMINPVVFEHIHACR